MRNVAPTRALSRRKRLLLELGFVAVAAGIFVALLGILLYAFPLTSSENNAFGLFNASRAFLFLGGVGLGLLGMGLAIRALTWKTDNDLAMMTAERLAPHLDDNYTFIRNINRRNLGYIDAMLVGPPGVLVLRIVDWEGTYLNEGARWLKQDRQGDWKPIFPIGSVDMFNPTREVIEDIQSLKKYLGERDIFDVPIFGAVVFTRPDPQAQIILKDSAVTATHLSSLYMRLQPSYLAKDRIDFATAQAIVKTIDIK